MKHRIDLDETDVKEALAAWAKQTYGQDVKAKDIHISFSPGDDDPRSPRGPHISNVSIELPGAPKIA
jgi:ABC-type oligopeptide transport system substrate-binding subunit